MPQDPAAALSSLLRASSIQDHDEILNAANAALKANKNDVASQHVKVVALLNLNRFDDALRVISAGGGKLDATCSLEKAYALYKTGALEEASEVLKTTGVKDRGFSHVAAQIHYRAERFDEARDVYENLLGAGAGEEENDININMAAALAQGLWQDSAFQSQATSDPAPDTFMLCFNAACAAMARGELDASLKLLQQAIRLCDASDDLTQEDKQAEMRPLLAQQAYVYAKMGKRKQALDLYRSLGSSDENDPDFTVVAENNRSLIEKKSKNPYLLQRKASTWADAGHKAKLFDFQGSLLARNVSVVDLKAQKFQGVEERTEKLLKKVQHPTTQGGVNSLSVLNAAASTHDATPKETVDMLGDLSKERPHDVGLALSMIQIQLKKGRAGAALSSLEEFLHRLEQSEEPQAKDVRHSPGLVALAVSLMRSRGHLSSAKAELVKAANHWKDRKATSAASVLREAGIELSKSSTPDDLALAGSAFETLFDEDQGSPIASAGLVAALAASDPSKVKQHIAKLPPIDTLVQGINVKDLLSSGVVAAPQSTTTKKRGATAPAPDRPTKKRRKAKLPKNYEEGKTPDPERWLPLRDRSSYRPKGKKGKKKAAESTQGGMVKEEETLELVGGGGVKVEKASGGGGGGASGKKKKKGKK